ncbi:MAG: hypothetical protein RIS35_703 [Pseudomonadota bacterium]
MTVSLSIAGSVARLRALFERFVRTRAIGRHFRRLTMLEGLQSASIRREVPPTLAEGLRRAALESPATLLERLGSGIEGLAEARAQTVRARVGPNVVEQDRPLRWWVHLWHCFATPFNVLLTSLALVSFLTEDAKATIVIAAMVILAVSVRFVQERRSHHAADALKAMVGNTATVLRPAASDARPTSGSTPPPSRSIQATQQEIPVAQLVPGDVVRLSAGDMIPADCRILVAKDLFVAQAAMTGESFPVEKFAVQPEAGADNPLDLADIVFMGTNVVSGAATAVVVGTGGGTYFGVLARQAGATGQMPTRFQTGVNRIAWLLIRFMLVMTPMVLLVNGFTKGDWANAFLFAMSIAVGLTPEMLPMIVTSTLARGAVLLSRSKVIVKRLDAIQAFGAMDVLCTDKTGTLTQDRIVLARHADVLGRDSDAVLEAAYLNSYHQTGLKNLLDVAVLENTEVHRTLDPGVRFPKVDEIPFDFERRRMSVIVASPPVPTAVSSPDGAQEASGGLIPPPDAHLLICKGAVEEVLSVCDRVRLDGEDLPLTPALLERARQVTIRFNEDGLRVVAVAVRTFPRSRETFGVADERGLTLLGCVAFLDPPKESAKPALESLAARGIRVKVLTGDSAPVTSKTCRDVGIADERVVLGGEVERMGDAALAAAVEAHAIFAKLTPLHKERIVRALRANGHVVGFLGDGINDAAALRAADVGISVHSAVDVAKEAADIILLEKSLLVLQEGVLQGRRTFVNMLKYIKMTASSNFGNVFSVLVAAALLPFLPMLPMHLLVQNLLYDFSQTAIPFDAVDEESVAAPQRWSPEDITRFMLVFGPLSAIFDLCTYAMMWFVFGADSPERQTLFQSGWFVEGLMTQTLVVHMIRTRRIPFLQSRPGGALLAATLAVSVVGVFLPMGPLAEAFKLQHLPWTYFPALLLILLGYAMLTQATKAWYSRRFGWN